MGKGKSQHQDLWEFQLSKSEFAMANGNLKDVITLATQTLNKFMETHGLKLLDLRATAYEKSGMLSRALEDAEQMIRYVPTSPTGYLKAGNILMTHGKPNLAAANYEKGLELVSNLHTQYQHMEEEYDKARLRAHSRFDIIGKLPRELVYKCLIHLDPERVWECLNVSRRWSEQISQFEAWWSSITVKKTGTEMDQAVCDAIPLIKDCIQRLELENLSSRELNKRYLMHLKSGIFTNLKALSLKGAFFHNILSEDLAIALWLLRGTLASLSIDFEDGKSFPLMLVLGSCPDITELCYTTTDEISLWKADSDYASCCKKLSNMELSYRDMTYDVLYSHLARCPNLRRLVLQTSGSYMLQGIDNATFTDHCPKLKILGLNSTEGLPNANDYEYSVDERGVAYMAVEFGYMCLYTQTVKQIQAHAHSLRLLNITHTNYDLCYHPWPRPYPSDTVYSKLNILQYKSHKDNVELYTRRRGNLTCLVHLLVGNILQTSPRLESVSLIGLQRSTSICIPLEQAVKTSIQTLTLASMSFNMSNDWYKGFFSSLEHVHTLVLQDMNLGDDRLPSLAASESIRHLTINECNGVTSEEVTKFLKSVALRSSHQLNTLDISNISMDHSTIRALFKINSLEHLRIASCKDFDVDSVSNLINNYATSSALKEIEISDCFPADAVASWSDSVARLKKEGINLVVK